MAKYKRILLKLSGESLMGEKQYGIDEKRLAEYAAQIKEIHELGVQIGIVIGGGNIFRGLSGANKGFDRVKGDQMGMLATVINSLALSSALVATGVPAEAAVCGDLAGDGDDPAGEACLPAGLFRRHSGACGVKCDDEPLLFLSHCSASSRTAAMAASVSSSVL